MPHAEQTNHKPERVPADLYKTKIGEDAFDIPSHGREINIIVRQWGPVLLDGSNLREEDSSKLSDAHRLLGQLFSLARQ